MQDFYKRPEAARGRDTTRTLDLDMLAGVFWFGVEVGKFPSYTV